MIHIIDPHLHLFALNKGKYDWLKPENPPFWPDKNIINHSFVEQDILLESPFKLDGFVHIEAGFDNHKPWREVEYLEQHMQLPMKTIACCDLCLPTELFIEQIIKTSKFQSVVGFRHILDDDALRLLSMPQVIRNLGYLAQQQWLFELQMPLSNAQACAKLFDVLERIPELKLSLNHAGFPAIDLSTQQAHQWQIALKKLAQLSHILLKCSGFEMQQRVVNLPWIQGIIDRCINHLGEQNISYASNFPLCLFQQSYQQTWLQLHQLFNTDVQLNQLLCADNAKRFYQLN